MTYQQDSCQTRRALLGTITSGVAALAGCSGGSEDGTPSESGPSSGPGGAATGQPDDSTPTSTATPRPPVLGNTTTTADSFKIDIKNPGAAAKIKLIESNGREVGTKTLTHATDEVAYDTKLISPGKYVARALTDDNTQVDSGTYEVSSNLTHTKVGTYYDTSQEKRSEWKDEGSYSTTDSLFIWVKNTGTAPTTVTGMEVTGDVPKPGKLDIIGRDSVNIYPGQEKVVVSDDAPFGVSNPEETKGIIEVTINNKYGEDITHVREVSYSEYGNPSVGPVIQKLTGDN